MCVLLYFPPPTMYRIYFSTFQCVCVNTVDLHINIRAGRWTAFIHKQRSVYNVYIRNITLRYTAHST